MDYEQIQQIVEDYNQTERDQADKLRVVFDWMNDTRTGYRHVEFGKYAWKNCWGWDRRDLQHERFVDSQVKQITDIDAGQPV